ncbi:MAG: methyltransferase domain-containing protein, partial [bacterium]|nr:methyltransferase domain-containing protein [bacterium]
NYRHIPSFIENLIIKFNFLQLNLITKYIFNNKSISVLDVGCGAGDYLKQLPKNYKKTGIDIKIDNKKSKLIEADFTKYNFNKKFDLINFSHSLEHFTNPTFAISKSFNLLNKNGVVIISLPVSDSFSFRFNSKKAFHLDPPRHIFIPNTSKFKKILQNNFSQVSTISILFEFPLDLFWTLVNSKYKYLIPIFPILKIIKPETKLFICRR